ncbi:MAG: hypothetical protein M1813_003427 [Trichoglossum hirsutum]|nr:MAG: hypothetical protein M1813_003427 [Trichoglossum hirsutum]
MPHKLNHFITHVDPADNSIISFKSASETDKLLFSTINIMPRPKRTKVERLQPRSRRVARAPVESNASKRRNLGREASSRAEDNSDDSDGLVTSLSQKRKSQAQTNGGLAMMRGGLGFGDIKGAHIRTGSASGHTENIGYAGAMERLKMRRDTALKARKEVERGQTEGEKPLETATNSTDDVLGDAKDTPGFESSVLAISNFKRRARQPSILRSAIQDPQDDNGEDVFEPEDESTPLRLSTSTPILQQGLSYGSSSSLSLPRSNSRKRKLTPSQLEAPRSSPPIAFDSPSTESQQEHPYSSPSFLEANDEHTEDGSRDRLTNSHVLSETMVPPRSSSPAVQDAGVSPDGHSNPEQQGASNQTTKRQYKRPSRKAQARKADQDEISGAEYLRSDGEGSADITTLTRNPRRKGNRMRKAPISTAALQNLLPRRRRRALPDEFDIIESSDIDSEQTRLDPYENESPIVAFKKVAKKRHSNSNGRKLGLGKAASKGEKGAPLQKRITETPATKVPRTYSRQVSSDKENDGLSSSSAEGDSLTPVDSNENTLSQENSKQRKKILKQVARKFKDVDSWELDFEEDTASSSSPLGAR